MRVVHLSLYDGGNGTANAAYRLHRSLLTLGYDSSMFVTQRRREEDDARVRTFVPSQDPLRRLGRGWRRWWINRDLTRYRATRPAGFESFSDDRTPLGRDVLRQLPQADVLHVHSMYQFLDYQSFFAAVPKSIPIVRTMHDMSFFTGGCHVDAGCGKHVDGCGACPQLGSAKTDDLSRQIWRRKHVALQDVDPHRLCVIAPSRWLSGEATRSALLRGFPVEVIPHGVDTETFRPRDRAIAREVLGVPPQAQVVLFVAEPIHRHVKGLDLLIQAMRDVSDLPETVLVTVGSGTLAGSAPVPHLHLGSVRNERLLSWIYNAADVFVIPSRQENFPLTALEAVACGVPVLGFAVGGIPEIVRHEVSGLLAPAKDVSALGAALRRLLLDGGERQSMSISARRIAVEEYTLERQARRYAAVYTRLLSVH